MTTDIRLTRGRRASAPPARRGPSLLARIRRDHSLYAVPAVIAAMALFLVPLVLNVLFAFTNWTSYSSVIKPNGFSNLVYLISQGYLQKGTFVTVTYAVIAMAGQNLFAIVFALMLRDTNRLNGFFRSLFFIPVLISPLATGYIWRALFAAHGPINGFIGIFAPGFDYEWLGVGATALPLVALTDAWKWTGLTTLVYIAGLNAIPKEIIEAATVDGAGPWQRFRHVVLPLLGPAITFNIAITLVTALSAYDVIVSMTGGGPGNDTQSLFYTMRTQFGQGFFGTGSALTLVITVLVIVVTLPLVSYLRRREVQL